MEPNLKMVTFNHIKHTSVGRNASPLVQKLGKCINCATGEADVDEVVDYSTLGMPHPMAPFLDSLELPDNIQITSCYPDDPDV